jgi:hypothetical protein
VNDLFPTAIVIAISCTLVPVLVRLFAREAPLVIVAFLLQIVAAIVHVVIVREYYGYGDMLGYWRGGMRLARGVEDGLYGVDQVFDLTFQVENSLPVPGNGRSTGSMHGVAAFLNMVVGESLYAICIAIAVVGFVGRVWLFAWVRRIWPDQARRLAYAVFFLPSTIFWSAALLKEGIAMPGLCFSSGAVFGMLALRRAHPVLLVVAVLGAVVMGLTKPYLLVPFAVSTAVGTLIRSRTTLASVPVVVLVAVGLVGIGFVFPRYALSSVVESAEELRSLGQSHAGGSTFSVPSGGLATLVPLGMITALLRPFFFEASSVLLLLSAAEMTLIAWILARVLRRPRLVWSALRRSWLFASSVAFVVVFSVALGLSTTNLGTLARYRAPMMPFYGIVLVAVLSSTQQRARLYRPRSTRNSHPKSGD